MYRFFAHPDHDHSAMVAEQAPLDTTGIVILAISGIAVIATVATLVILNLKSKKKPAPKHSK